MKTFAAATLMVASVLATAPLADEGLKLSLQLSSVPRVDTRVPSAAPPAAISTSTIKDYRIGPEDLLEVQVFGVDQLSRTVRVNSRGQVSLPLIGAIEVVGMTAQEAERAITARLAENYLQNPQVSLFIKEFTTQRITIEGAVNRPGVYPLRGQGTLLTSIALAGGQGGMSDMKEVMLFRTDATGKRVFTTHDVERIRRGEVEDPPVYNDDLIVVNRDPNRTALKDSLFRDVIDTINPFRWGAVP